MRKDPALSGNAQGFSFVLEREAGRLQLRASHRPEYGAIYADWGSAELRRRIAAGRRQLLGRAAGLPRRPDPELLDATAGLGRDGFTLAALGAQVTMVERHPQIAALLEDARIRALDDARLHAAAARVQVIQADALTVLASGRWDVIYLDPMYPHSAKSALPQKEMQIFRELTGGDPDADALLAAALTAARQRVVVKRPLRAPPLGGTPPALQMSGTQARFDVYLIAPSP